MKAIETRQEYDVLRLFTWGMAACSVAELHGRLHPWRQPSDVSESLVSLPEREVFALLHALERKHLVQRFEGYGRRTAYATEYQSQLRGQGWRAAKGVEEACTRYQIEVLGEVPEWLCGCGIVFRSETKRPLCFSCFLSRTASGDWPKRPDRILAALKKAASPSA
jgi:hypothetical protein